MRKNGLRPITTTNRKWLSSDLRKNFGGRSWRQNKYLVHPAEFFLSSRWTRERARRRNEVGNDTKSAGCTAQPSRSELPWPPGRVSSRRMARRSTSLISSRYAAPIPFSACVRSLASSWKGFLEGWPDRALFALREDRLSGEATEKVRLHERRPGL